MSRSRHHTGWAGALAVAAELSRRGYDASVTLGNTPALDLLCVSPSGTQFKVQVKSLTAGNWVLIRKNTFERCPEANLFFAVVLVPEEHERPFEYHIVTHTEACALYRTQRKARLDGQEYKPGMDGLAWGQVKPHKDRWDKLPK